jgi:carboxyl-terminal processing protease
MTSALDRSQLLIAALLIVAMALLAGGAGVYVLSDPGIRSSQRLLRAARIIDTYFYRHVDWFALSTEARRGMIDRLDRFSQYVPAEQFAQMEQDRSGGYSGIGVTVSDHDDGLLVLSVRQPGPAAQAGMLPGDVIIGADGTELSGLSMDQATDLLKGPEGSDVRVKIYRPAGPDTLNKVIRRGRLEFEHIPFAGYTQDSILYLKLVDFDPGAGDAVTASLDSLLTGETHPRGIILDLRGNPGGLFWQAFETAELFLPEGALIVGTEGRSRWDTDRYRSQSSDRSEGTPMAVLVDQGSASSSEIVAGALRQNGRAVLVGDTTYGKGLVQGFVHFPGGDGLRLTISRYYLAGGVYLNDFDTALNEIGRGLAPDHYLAPLEEEPFLRALNGSLLLHQFAFRHQEELVREMASDTLSDQWLERLKEFCLSRDFEFTSEITQQAHLADSVGVLESSGSDVQDMLDRLVRISEERDRNLFLRYSDYLKWRLRALAVQREQSGYRAYAEVIVPHDPVINRAVEVLMQNE